jgi:hypothetical protein
MPAPFSHQDQSSDIDPADIDFLRICQDMLPVHSDNVIRTVEGFRSNDRGYDGAALRLCFANARNIAEAYLNAVAVAEDECKAHLAARGQHLFHVPVMTPPVARTERPSRGTPTGVPAIVPLSSFA